MTLKFNNTLTGHIDEFISLVPNKVTLYTCGPTVYDYPHVGNWTSYIYWDILVRILTANNYEVRRVINITDVGHLTSDEDHGEDKLEKGAKREGKTAWEIASFYTDVFFDGFKKLNMVQPQYFAKATDYIPHQIDLIRTLKQKGYTYQTSDGIYFDTSKFPTYADFAKLKLDSLKAGARVAVNPEKKQQSDFALWKFSPSGQKRDMEWETPQDLLDESTQSSGIVMGFPGWAIECSAMAMNLLGKTIDIHTGGIDHIPVHHSNEIAQSEAATGVRFANYWLHNNHLKVNSTKISKSLGNGYGLKEIEDKGFSAQDFRMFVLQGHYKNEGNFTFEGLQAAKNRLHNWRNFAALRHQTSGSLQDDNEKSTSEKSTSFYTASQSIIEAVSNDLGTPEALRIIDDTFTYFANGMITEIDERALNYFLETIDKILGIQIIDSTPDIDDDTKQIIIERSTARAQHDWEKSDTLREQLERKNIAIKDTENGSIWEYKI